MRAMSTILSTMAVAGVMTLVLVGSTIPLAWMSVAFTAIGACAARQSARLYDLAADGYEARRP